jgi:polyisoprenoid-binding protein YceI
MRRIVATNVTILSLAAMAVAGCAKDPTEGKTAATVAEAKPVAAAPAAATTETLIVAPDSKLGFVGAKVTEEHVGEFRDFSGKISLAQGKIEGGKVEFEVKPAALVVDGGLQKLEDHLRSPDFFDVEKFPVARFVSTEIKPGSEVDGNNYTVTGNFEIRGVTKSVTFPAQIDVGTAAVTAKTEFGINRKDFGIEYPGMPDNLIKDNVLIRVDLKAPRGTADKN